VITLKNNIKIPLIILASIVGIVVVIGLVGFAYIYTAQEQEVSDRDRDLIISPVQLEAYFADFKAVQPDIEYSKVKYIDGELELRMDYDNDDESQPYMSVVVTKSHKASDALSTYYIAWTTHVALYNAYDSNFEVIEDNEFFSLGERSRFAVINYSGEPLGNRFVFMQDKTVYEFTLTGFYIDDAKIWQELFTDKLERLKGFE